MARTRPVDPKPIKPPRKSRRGRGSIIGALDIGSSKICCFIARIEDEDCFRVIGFSHQLSEGVKAGSIADLEAAEAIGKCLHGAEKMAGLQIEEVFVNVGGGHVGSAFIGGETEIAGTAIGEGDIARALSAARNAPVSESGTVIQAIPVRYRIDDDSGIADPAGLCGSRLAADMTLVTACPNRLRNIDLCVGHNHMAVGGRCSSGYAAGLATLHPDELELGCLLLDIGGGTTDIAVFRDGAPIFLSSLPIGGQHMTNDLARGLTTTIACAERLKTMHGSVMRPFGAGQLIEVPQVGEDEPGCANQVAASEMVGILRPRVEELLELVRARLIDAGVDKLAGRRAVITGGASQLTGLREFAQGALGRQVRIARPHKALGLAEANGGPAFSTGAGLLLYALRNLDEAAESAAFPQPQTHLLGRVGQWLRLNL